MKKLTEITECMDIINKMFEEWDNLPKVDGHEDFQRRREIEKLYRPKIREAYYKYKQEHPEEFEEDKVEENG